MTAIGKLKKYSMVVGRAATGIYLVLKKYLHDAQVLLPANICYAAVYPVVYSGNSPVFCDVSEATGNVTLQTVTEGCTRQTKAVIIPHMYGNPVEDIQKIADYCKSRSILLIEDCASAMGATVQGKMVGAFGDYSVFSTGYAKTIDLGNGGLLLSDETLEELKPLYAKLPLYSNEIAQHNGDFSREYRQFRNSTLDIRKTGFYTTVHKDRRGDFLYRAEADFETLLYQKMNELDAIVSRRRSANALYDSFLLYDETQLSRYPFSDGAVPWRKNILVPEENRDRIVHSLLQAGVPVSDWYPVIGCFFEDYSRYPHALSMERRILNFPLMISDNEIVTICKRINTAVWNEES